MEELLDQLVFSIYETVWSAAESPKITGWCIMYLISLMENNGWLEESFSFSLSIYYSKQKRSNNFNLLPGKLTWKLKRSLGKGDTSTNHIQTTNFLGFQPFVFVGKFTYMLWHVPRTPTCDPTDLSNWFFGPRSRQIMSSTSLTLRSLKRTMICLVSHLFRLFYFVCCCVFFCFKKNTADFFVWILDIYDFPIYLVTVKIEDSLDMEPAWILDALHGESVFMISWKVEVRKLMVKLIATPQTRFSPQKEANEGKSPFFREI